MTGASKLLSPVLYPPRPRPVSVRHRVRVLCSTACTFPTPRHYGRKQRQCKPHLRYQLPPIPVVVFASVSVGALSRSISTYEHISHRSLRCVRARVGAALRSRADARIYPLPRTPTKERLRHSFSCTVARSAPRTSRARTALSTTPRPRSAHAQGWRSKRFASVDSCTSRDHTTCSPALATSEVS